MLMSYEHLPIETEPIASHKFKACDWYNGMPDIKT